MATIKVKECDLCGALMKEEEATVKTTSFKGKTSGSFSEDLCPDCTVVPEGVALTPLRTRSKATTEEAPPSE